MTRQVILVFEMEEGYFDETLKMPRSELAKMLGDIEVSYTTPVDNYEYLDNGELTHVIIHDWDNGKLLGTTVAHNDGASDKEEKDDATMIEVVNSI